ncbi:MAG TPA: hypothetical protein VJZ94_02460 [Candidatus Paceibacterota bacterium]|nr:hypothetical protein [Candidatus Paceibacterota bacterium]
MIRDLAKVRDGIDQFLAGVGRATAYDLGLQLLSAHFDDILGELTRMESEGLIRKCSVQRAPPAQLSTSQIVYERVAVHAPTS